MKKIRLVIVGLILLNTFSCGVIPRSDIESKEKFVVGLNRTHRSRGIGSEVLGLAIQGVFLGANKLVEMEAQSLVNSYSKSLSLNDYYTKSVFNSKAVIEKTYNKIIIKKYSQPKTPIKKDLREDILADLQGHYKSRSADAAFDMSVPLNPELSLSPDFQLSGENIFRDEENDIMNFYAVIEIESAPNDPSVSRLVFEDLRVFYSKTKVYKKDDLNALVSIAVEGQWEDKNGNIQKGVLLEQEFKLTDLVYKAENQIDRKIYTDWYQDLPIAADAPEGTFGVVKIKVQLKEYDSGKGKYVNKLPDILSENKSSFIKGGTKAIQEVIKLK